MDLVFCRRVGRGRKQYPGDLATEYHRGTGASEYCLRSLCWTDDPRWIIEVCETAYAHQIFGESQPRLAWFNPLSILLRRFHAQANRGAARLRNDARMTFPASPS